MTEACFEYLNGYISYWRLLEIGYYMGYDELDIEDLLEDIECM